MQSNPDYQYEHGLLAHHENDFEEAESWYTRAADQGHSKAQFDLGMMYFRGEIEGMEVGECVEHAVSYCMDAAENGHECARAFLDRDVRSGLEAYRRGNDSEAELEFRRLAEQGNAEAEFRLARMYVEYRIAVDYDVQVFENARDWFRRAAVHGWARAEYGLYATLAGEYVFADYTVDPVEHVDEAQKWYWKAAERTPHEQYELGLRSEGDPDHADETEAVFWYRLAAGRGHVNAQYRLGVLDPPEVC